MKKVSAILTNSLGELDIVLPIFSELRLKKKFNFCIYITSKTINDKLIKDTSYFEICKKLEIEIIYCRLYNKFDFKIENKYSSKIYRLFMRIYRLFMQKFLDTIFIFRNFKIFFSSIIMNDASSNELKNSILDIILFKFLKKINYVYHHGHAPCQIPKLKSKLIINKNAVVLSFHQSMDMFWKSKGYKNIFVIGFPKFFPTWINLINNLNNFKINEEYIVIYSRKADHAYYMTKENYFYLLTETYRCIRNEFDDIKIIIKPHPRENIKYIEEIMKSKNMKNIEVSYLNVAMLAKKAKFTISFWSSAILDSFSFNIPGIEFYIETKKFRIVEPEGSLYKKLGIDSAQNYDELEKIFKKIKNKKYIEPNIIKEFKNYKNLNIFYS